jgi:BMFP domain-containing protein YqiC
MTQTSNRLFDDLAKLMTDAAGAAQGFRRDAEAAVKAQMERLLQSMDVVTREEFEAVRAMAVKAREENDRLAARLMEVEKRLGIAPQATEGAAKEGAAKAEAPPREEPFT